MRYPRIVPAVLGSTLLLAACQNPGMQRIEQRMTRLAGSVREKLGPDRLVQRWTRRLDHAAHEAPEVLLDDDVRQLERGTARAVAGVVHEIERRPRHLETTGLTLLEDSADRLVSLTDPPSTWHLLGPERSARRVRHVAENWPYLLLLDKPLLPDMRDARYRTDPDDDRPEATWLERILVRLGI